MQEYLVIITQSAAKQIQRLQTMKSFYFIHLLMQEWKSADMKGTRDVIVKETVRLEVCCHYKLPISQTEGSKHHLPIRITE